MNDAPIALGLLEILMHQEIMTFTSKQGNVFLSLGENQLSALSAQLVKGKANSYELLYIRTNCRISPG